MLASGSTLLVLESLFRPCFLLCAQQHNSCRFLRAYELHPSEVLQTGFCFVQTHSLPCLLQRTPNISLRLWWAAGSPGGVQDIL